MKKCFLSIIPIRERALSVSRCLISSVALLRADMMSPYTPQTGRATVRIISVTTLCEKCTDRKINVYIQRLFVSYKAVLHRNVIGTAGMCFGRVICNDILNPSDNVTAVCG